MKDEQAFPITIDLCQQGIEWHKGMTLRDYFAAKAMQAAITGLLSVRTLHTIDKAEVVRFSMQMADAMLEEREKK